MQYMLLGTVTLEIEVRVEASNLAEAQRKMQRAINNLTNRDIVEHAYSRDIDIDIEDIEEIPHE